jgi:hypothetical protein
MVTIPKGVLNAAKNIAIKKANVAGFKGQALNAVANLISTNGSILKGVAAVGAVEGGIKALTGNVSQLTDAVPGLKTPIGGGTSGDIEKITGTIAAAGLNVAIAGGSGSGAIGEMLRAGEGVVSRLLGSTSIGLSGFTGVLSKVSGLSVGNVIGDLALNSGGILGTAAGALSQNLNRLTNVGIGQPIKDLIEKTSGNIGNTLSAITANQGKLLPNDVKDLIGKVDGGLLNDAANIISNKVSNGNDLITSLGNLGNNVLKNLSAEAKAELAKKIDANPALKKQYIEEALANIKTNAADVVDKGKSNNTAVGKSTSPDKQIGGKDSTWNGDSTSDDRHFDIVTSFEELESELKAAERDITEVIVNWTESYNSENLTPNDIFKEIKSRKSNGHWHFLIFPTGTITKVAPVGETTNHTSFGGWKRGDTATLSIPNKDSHNKHSIGIAFVGGLDDDNNTFITERHQESFTKFMRTFYKVYPGGQAWGARDLIGLDQGYENPGFDVQDYVKSIFNKVNTTAADEKALGAKDLKAKMIENANG